MGDDRTCHCIDLGALSVPAAEDFMTAAVQKRVGKEIPDLLLLLSHPPTVALGMKGRFSDHPKDLLVSLDRLRAEGIAFSRSLRGGGITYHWPGQVVCYPVLALGPAERNIPGYMGKLEETAIQTLRTFGLEAVRRRDTAAHIGLWVDGRKVASMGVRVSRWVTSFGFALNLEGDFSPSRYVRPCGLDGVRLITVEKILGSAPSRELVVETLKESFASVFDRILSPAPGNLLLCM
jgi:lipoate-protein ligase B